MFVYQDSVRIESWLRDGDNWSDEPIILLSLVESLPLPALETELPLAVIYDRVL